MKFKPRDYHHAALTALKDAEAQGRSAMLIAHATGLGKTLLFAWWIEHRKGRTIVLAHRDELIRQARRKLRLVLGKDTDIGIVKGEWDEGDARIVVASVQSLSAARLATLGTFQQIVVDEAHHVQAVSYQRILKELGTFNGTPTLGVTATPMRGDKKPLSQTFQSIVHHMAIKDGIDQGYLCNLRALRVSTKANLATLKLIKGDVHQGQAGAAFMDAGAPEEIAEAIKLHAEGRPTLVFCPTIEMSKAVAKAVRKVGRRCRHIDGDTDFEIRKTVKQKLRDGWVVTNCGVYTEGFDCPELSCVVLARPTKSENLYIQMVGRVTRRHPDKADGLILDVVGATMRHDLCTSAVLELGISEEEEYYKRRAAEIHEQAKRKNMPDWLRDIWQRGEQKRGERVEVATAKVDLWSTRPFAWVKTHIGYVLGIGMRGKLLLLHDSQTWRVLREDRDGERHLLFKNHDLSYAQGWSEDWVREKGLTALCRRDADWRGEPMTEGQAHMLERWRVPHTEEWTKGQASEAIEKAIANARKR